MPEKTTLQRIRESYEENSMLWRFFKFLYKINKKKSLKGGLNENGKK